MSVSGTLTVLVTHGRSMLRRWLLILGGFDLLYPFGVFLCAHWRGQTYWRFFEAEGNFTAWWSSLQLLLIAGCCYLIYRFRWLSVRAGVLPRADHDWIWLVTALGFVLFSLDERFGFHEWLRDAVFRPMDLFTGSRYVIDGDAGLYLFLLLGLGATPLLLRDLEGCSWAVRFFWGALALTIPVLVIDSLRTEVMQRLPEWRFWDYPFEEVGEIWAQWGFLAAFAGVLDHWLALWSESRSVEGHAEKR